jgi:phosphatidylinositol alpha-mannosyltransferase
VPATPLPSPPGEEGRRLTVGLLLDDGLDRPDGVQQYVLALARHLSARGHDVHLVASTTRRTDLDHLHVLGRNLAVRFNGNVLSTPLPARAADVRALLADVPFDVLHVCLPHSPLLTGRVVRAAAPDVAVVGTFLILPTSPLAEAGTRALGALERRTLARFDEVIALSGPAGEFARRAFGMRSTVIGMPLDLAAFPAPPPRPAVTGRPLRVVFLGRLVARKGPRELVDAAAYAVDHRLTSRPWTLTMAGRGPLDDDLRRRVVAAGLADRVDFPGFVAEGAKAALLADADLVVLPSTGGESFGVSVVEALAGAGGPVLAGDNPGYRSTMAGLEDQLVDPRDRAGFGRALARWLDDEPGRAAAVTRQRAAARRFDAALVTDEIEAVYRRALGRHDASHA